MIEKKNDETHPELREGEMFLTNCTIPDYVRIGWKTKRIGRQAYTIDGEKLKVLIPVFVQKEEYDEGMKKHDRHE